MRETTTAALLALVMVLTLGLRPALAEDRLQAFCQLVEGTWIGEGTRHVFEWGAGNRAIRSRTYAQNEGDWQLVGEGMWFWDPAEEQLRGVAVATGMPVELFEYQSELEGDEVIHALTAQGPAGGRFIERWSFAGEEYRWALETEAGERLMGGAYHRAPAAFAPDTQR